jgi:hypothetical protein
MEATTMKRVWVIHLCGLFTLLGAILFSLLLLDGEVAARLIPGYHGLLNFVVAVLTPSPSLPTAGQVMLLQLVGVGFLSIPTLCVVSGTLGLWLLQRGWLGNLAGGLALLGPLVGVLSLFVRARSLVLIAFLLLGMGLLLFGVLVLRSHVLRRWNALPLVLGLCLVAYSLRLVIWDVIPVPDLVIQRYAAIATTGYLVVFVLWGGLGYRLWASDESSSAQVVPQLG